MLKLNHVSLTFNQGTQDEKKAIDDVTLHVKKGDFISIIGANGAGKSTLFRMITGIEKPDSGSIKLGDTVVTAYVEQFRDQMK
ncbi:MAG: ATP-binding cassette domain-containing protein, partial [Lachnospiraceae bacterium]|nr:ATP-binding cassette domain-containing protein [Lachnospiraceae bacterium]